MSRVLSDDSLSWQKVREVILSRDDYQCVNCGAGKKMRTLNVHHILPVSEGGGEEFDNLVTLCDPCHSAVHKFGDGPRYPPEILDGVTGIPEPESPDLDGVEHFEMLPEYHSLTGFYREILAITIGSVGLSGAQIQERLEPICGDSVNNSRLYPALDALVEENYLEKIKVNGRRNEYTVTEKGKHAVFAYRDWLNQTLPVE